MRNHTVEIGDKRGRSFKMEVSTPSVWTRLKNNAFDGSWRTIDKGYIKINSGDARRYYSGDDATTANLHLREPGGDDTTTGIILYKYDDWSGTNDEGRGFIVQSWVLNIDPGEVTWALAD